MKQLALTYLLRRLKGQTVSRLKCNWTIPLLCVLSGFAYTSLEVNASDLAKHYIIAFDQSVGNYKPVYSSPTTLNAISRVLAENGFNRESDYLSIVGYSMPLGNPSSEDFVQPYTDKNGLPIIWTSVTGDALSDYFPNWPQGQPTLNAAKAPFGSMQSLAKPYIVMETHTHDGDTVNADKTIMLIVSDEVINGTDDDYRQEWNHVSVTPGANTAKFRSLANGVFKTMNNFNEEFKFVQTPIQYNGKMLERISLTSDGNYKIIPYEVVAAEKPSIHSVTDMPSPLPLKRVRGGFKLNMETQTINPKYQISSIDIATAQGDSLGRSEDGTFDFVIPSSAISEGDTLLVAMKLLLKDGFYDGAAISPVNDRYRAGMSVKQVVKLQDEAKVLGLFPLKDIFWWWFPNDIFTAVMIWDLLILLAIMGTVTWLLYRWNKKTMIYRVEPHEISLHCIQNPQRVSSHISVDSLSNDSLKKSEDGTEEFLKESEEKEKETPVKPIVAKVSIKQKTIENPVGQSQAPPPGNNSRRVAEWKNYAAKSETLVKENIESNSNHIAALVAQLQNPAKNVISGLSAQGHNNRTK